MPYSAHPESATIIDTAHSLVSPLREDGPLTSQGPGRRAFQGPAARIHDLKCWPPYWDLVNRGVKTFEIRLNDRGYRAGDLLILREWVPADWLAAGEPGYATGRTCHRTITNVFTGGKFGLAEGYVALSLAVAR